ncbi:MAG: pantoate--beta-alanine ligase [Candidatus Woesearchaeota archaeon]
MKNRAIFLDRDGTLNEDKGYTYKIEDLKIYPDVIENLKRVKNYKLFIITNQSGIERGFFTEKDMHNFNEKLLQELKKEDISIEKIFFCPHKPETKCSCRKPYTDALKIAEKEYNLNLSNSFVIGDHYIDVILAKNNNCKSIYLLTGQGVKNLEKAKELFPDYVAANFKQAIDYILFDKYEKIVKREELSNLIKKLRKEKKIIVTLNGTFDILHKGHEKIIKEAKEQGDILIVGINSDNSVKKNKGPNRPINNDYQRAKMIANFDEVDYVTIFNETTPIKMLEIIKPDIHVNGSEYGENCIEAPTVKKYGGKIYLVKLLEGYSTTKILGEKFKKIIENR